MVGITDVSAFAFLRKYLSHGHNTRWVLNEVEHIVVVVKGGQLLHIFNFKRTMERARCNQGVNAGLPPLLVEHFSPLVEAPVNVTDAVVVFAHKGVHSLG